MKKALDNGALITFFKRGDQYIAVHTENEETNATRADSLGDLIRHFSEPSVLKAIAYSTLLVGLGNVGAYFLGANPYNAGGCALINFGISNLCWTLHYWRH